MDTSDRLVEAAPSRMMYHDWFAALRLGDFLATSFGVERCMKTWSCTVLQVKTLDFSGVFLCAGLYTLFTSKETMQVLVFFFG